MRKERGKQVGHWCEATQLILIKALKSYSVTLNTFRGAEIASQRL